MQELIEEYGGCLMILMLGIGIVQIFERALGLL